MNDPVLTVGKVGSLCFGGFEPGSGTYWEVRRLERRGVREWVLYRTSVAVTEMGRFTSPERAYDTYAEHVPPCNDLESSMGG